MPRRKKEEEALLSAKDRVPRGTANARERTRMRVLSKAFGRLKLTLPWVPPDTKLSKLDTLRLATSYIGHLKRVLQADDQGAESEVDGDNNAQQSQKSREQDHLTMHCWPYGHHRLCHGGEHSIGHFKANKVRLPEKSSDDDFVVDYCSTTTAAANTAAGGIVPDSSSSSLPPLPTQTSAYFPTAFSESDIDRTGDEQATFVLMQHHAG